MKKALFALLILFAFSIIPLANANFIPVTEQAFNIFMFIFVPVLATAFFAVLIAWLIGRRRKQKAKVPPVSRETS